MNLSVPRCFNSHRQFELWLDAARQSPPDSSSYCTDCTLEYRQRMITQNRCAYPKTKFCIDSDGFVEGQRPVEDRVQRRAVA